MMKIKKIIYIPSGKLSLAYTKLNLDITMRSIYIDKERQPDPTQIDDQQSLGRKSILDMLFLAQR